MKTNKSTKKKDFKEHLVPVDTTVAELLNSQNGEIFFSKRRAQTLINQSLKARKERVIFYENNGDLRLIRSYKLLEKSENNHSSEKVGEFYLLDTELLPKRVLYAKEVIILRKN